MGSTYEARKSTPTGLGSRRKLRDCKSDAKTACKFSKRSILTTNYLQTQKEYSIKLKPFEYKASGKQRFPI